jgi:hypothetical protein
MSSAPAKWPASPDSTWWRRHRRGLRWATAWVPIVVIAFLLIGYSDIVLVKFSGSGIAPPQLSCGGMIRAPCGLMGNVSIPPGVNVTVQWADLSGGTAGYWIVAENLGFYFGPIEVCGGYGPSLGCHFISVGGVYEFGAGSFVGEPNQTVSYTGTYYTSLL